ncbi:MAG: PorP/SprF family type IX secretion system membrane protein [Bacteroidota bacterium]|nr:PorP/SprF family type IX secretion system membrane protein [Bacteroidota bacterium]
MSVKKIKLRFVFVVVGLFMLMGVNAQELVFSQYFNNPVNYNPATIGLNTGMKLRFQYRDQWVNLPGEFNTLSFNIDIAERNIPGSGGFALIVNRNQQGQGYLENTMFGLGTSVRIRLQDNIISQLGILGTFVQKNINWDNLIFSDELDPRYGNIYETGFIQPNADIIRYPDLAVGNVIRFFVDSYSADKVIGTFGVALHHVFKPDESFIGLKSNIPHKYVAHGDVLIEKYLSSNYRTRSSVEKKFKLNFGFIYENMQDISNFSVGVNMMRSNLYLGTWYRGESYGDFNTDALIFMVGVNTTIADNARIKIMYSYDWALNDLISISGPTHEITLSFQFDDVMLFGSGDKYNITPSAGKSALGPLECSPF